LIYLIDLRNIETLFEKKSFKFTHVKKCPKKGVNFGS